MTPTQRSLRQLRKDGYLVEVVEHWNHFANIREDLFGFIDLLAIRQDVTLGVQVTSGSNASARVRKIATKCEEAATMWLAAGNLIQVHAWRALAAYNKDGRRSQRDRWEPRIVAVTIEMIQGIGDDPCPTTEPTSG